MRVVMQCIHFTNTMLLLAAITLTWWWLRDRPQPSTDLGPQARAVAWISLIATLFVGGTGSVAALADTLFPPTSLQAAFLQDFAAHSPLLVRMRWLHPATALIALSCAIWLALQLRSKLGRLVVGLVCAATPARRSRRASARTHLDAGASPPWQQISTGSPWWSPAPPSLRPRAAHRLPLRQ